MENPTRKSLISMRVKKEILDWFKSKSNGSGYQTLMHNILDSYVSEQKLKESHTAGRAQELFNQYYTQCFWHYKSNLIISPENMHLVVEGLKKYGGHEGYKIAAKLCQ